MKLSHGMILAVFIGFFVPGGAQFKWLITYLLGLMLFFSFLKLDCDLKKFFRKELLYYLPVTFIIAPLIVFILTENLAPDLRLGVFLMVIAPVGMATPVLVGFVKGNRELAVSNVVAYNLISPLTYPLLLSVFFRTFIEVPAELIFTKIAAMLFIPLFLALLTRKFMDSKTALYKRSDLLVSLALMLIIVIAVSCSVPALREMELYSLMKISSIVLIISLALFGIGHSLSSEKQIKKSLSIIFGYKNTGLGLWVAISTFSSIVALPTVLYLIFHQVIVGILIDRFNKQG